MQNESVTAFTVSHRFWVVVFSFSFVSIQNLEIKMESQINSLETRIEKMQERFNKDLEEIRVNI